MEVEQIRQKLEDLIDEVESLVAVTDIDEEGTRYTFLSDTRTYMQQALDTLGLLGE